MFAHGNVQTTAVLKVKDIWYVSVIFQQCRFAYTACVYIYIYIYVDIIYIYIYIYMYMYILLIAIAAANSL